MTTYRQRIKERAKRISHALILAFIVIFGTIIFGWIFNIIKIFGIENILTGEGILRLIGVPLIPLGGILGFL